MKKKLPSTKYTYLLMLKTENGGGWLSLDVYRRDLTPNYCYLLQIIYITMDKLLIASINKIRQSTKRPDTDAILKQMQKQAAKVLASMLESGRIENRTNEDDEYLWVAKSSEKEKASSSLPKTGETLPSNSMQPITTTDNGDDAKWDDFESFKKFIHGEVLDLKSRLPADPHPKKAAFLITSVRS